MTKDRTDLWNNDEIQFCRLLAEIRSADAIIWGRADLMASMNLTDVQIEELFDRAEVKWERYKKELTWQGE